MIGTFATTFDPGSDVTGYQLLVMLLRVLGYGQAGEFSNSRTWELETAKIAEREGILKNVTTGDLGAAAPRAMVAEILFRGLLTDTVQYSIMTPDGYTKGETLGMREFKLEEIEGVVTGSEFADLKSTQVLDKGQTQLRTEDSLRNPAISTRITDIGESRYAYITGTKVLAMGDTGKNKVNTFGHASRINTILADNYPAVGAGDPATGLWADIMAEQTAAPTSPTGVEDFSVNVSPGAWETAELTVNGAAFGKPVVCQHTGNAAAGGAVVTDKVPSTTAFTLTIKVTYTNPDTDPVPPVSVPAIVVPAGWASGTMVRTAVGTGTATYSIMIKKGASLTSMMLSEGEAEVSPWVAAAEAQARVYTQQGLEDLVEAINDDDIGLSELSDEQKEALATALETALGSFAAVINLKCPVGATLPANSNDNAIKVRMVGSTLVDGSWEYNRVTETTATITVSFETDITLAIAADVTWTTEDTTHTFTLTGGFEAATEDSDVALTVENGTYAVVMTKTGAAAPSAITNVVIKVAVPAPATGA